jgi:hypothetical protein
MNNYSVKIISAKDTRVGNLMMFNDSIYIIRNKGRTLEKHPKISLLLTDIKTDYKIHEFFHENSEIKIVYLASQKEKELENKIIEENLVKLNELTSS